MARTVKPIGKFLILLAIFALGVGAYFYANSIGLLDKVAPKGRQVQSIQEVKEAEVAKESGVKTLKVCVVTWGGYAGGQFFNEGFAASTTSRFYKDYGFMVKFVVMDDFQVSREAWKKGEVDILWVTADAYPTEVAALIAAGFDPKFFFQADWSRGGDAIVVAYGINSMQDLKGKKIAVALGTPSHSFLLKMLQAAGMEYTDVKVVGVASAIDAAALFKNGAADAAVVWSPDDLDCTRSVSGSKVMISTEKATQIIADGFFVKRAFLEENKKELAGLVEGWLRGAGEINSDPAAKEKAIRILMKGLNIDEELARNAINKVRLTTYGDNVNFFNLSGNHAGVKGEDIYNSMGRLYFAVNLAPAQLPAWRSVTDTSILRSINLSGPQNAAEGGFSFAKPTRVEETAPAISTKQLSVTFASGSAVLDPNAKIIIDMGYAETLKSFGNTRVRIEGNTDSVGNEEMNRRLSFQRAQAVADYLIAKYGYDPNRFIIVGNGSSKPIASNETLDGKAKNRRTDFQLLNN